MGTESIAFNERSCRVEPLNQAALNGGWLGHPCGPLPAGGAPNNNATACAAFNNWFNDYGNVRERVNFAPANNGVTACAAYNAWWNAAARLKGVRWNHNVIIRGRVTNSSTHQPISDAQVASRELNVEVLCNLNGEFILSSTTNRFPGTFRLRVIIGRFTSNRRRVEIRFPGFKETVNFSLLPIEVTPPIVPNNGPVGGGTNITINGSGFVPGNTRVTLGDRDAQNVVAVVNRITAQTPAGEAAGNVDVIVETPDGAYRLPAGFRYQA